MNANSVGMAIPGGVSLSRMSGLVRAERGFAKRIESMTVS